MVVASYYVTNILSLLCACDFVDRLKLCDFLCRPLTIWGTPCTLYTLSSSSSSSSLPYGNNPPTYNFKPNRFTWRSISMKLNVAGEMAGRLFSSQTACFLLDVWKRHRWGGGLLRKVKSRATLQVNYRKEEAKILDSVMGASVYDSRIRPSGINGTGAFLYS